jgi:DDE family transposase
MRVCRNRRIHQHKTCKDVAEKGFYSTGWFYGFKLHLIINDKGEILSFYLIKDIVDDLRLKVMESMTADIFGKLFGEKG